jgi:hypothetical protein
MAVGKVPMLTRCRGMIEPMGRPLSELLVPSNDVED